MKKSHWGRLALTSAMGLILSSTFVLLAALPIRYTRLQFGRFVFVLTTFLGTTTLLFMQQWQWASVYFGLNLLIGSYRELEEKKWSIFNSSFLSIVLTSTVFFGGMAALAFKQGLGLIPFLTKHLEPMVVQLKELPRFKDGVDLNQVIQFLPSGFVITLMVITFITLIFYMDSAPRKKSLEILKSFTLPDWMIWVFLASVAGTFIKTGVEEAYIYSISVNLFAISIAAYFFQGIAVLSSLLDRFRIFGFWRWLAYILVVFQLFAFVCGLGILDFWFNFREQLKIDNKTRTFSS